MESSSQKNDCSMASGLNECSMASGWMNESFIASGLNEWMLYGPRLNESMLYGLRLNEWVVHGRRIAWMNATWSQDWMNEGSMASGLNEWMLHGPRTDWLNEWMCYGPRTGKKVLFCVGADTPCSIFCTSSLSLSLSHSVFCCSCSWLPSLFLLAFLCPHLISPLICTSGKAGICTSPLSLDLHLMFIALNCAFSPSDPLTVLITSEGL